VQPEDGMVEDLLLNALKFQLNKNRKGKFMKHLSRIFTQSNPGQKGRRLTRHLQDDMVLRATNRNKDIFHRMKFMSRSQKEGAILRKLILNEV
jgi:hypothetical protein